jgi:hypothetical protein
MFDLVTRVVRADATQTELLAGSAVSTAEAEKVAAELIRQGPSRPLLGPVRP